MVITQRRDRWLYSDDVENAVSIKRDQQEGGNMKLVVSVLVVVVFITISSLSAQIVIDWTEIPQDIGTEWISNSKDTVTVDLGSTGGGQTWDFTTQPMGEDSNLTIIVSVSSTPFADSFPTANVAYETPVDNDTIIYYSELASNFVLGLGYAVISDSSHVICFDPADSVSLPISYGDNRHYNFAFEVEPTPGVVVKSETYGYSEIDAYGTVTIPYGTFPCLRECMYDTFAMTTFIGGIPMFGDTVYHINYRFLTEDYGNVTNIRSNEEETNPNYTDASSIYRLIDFSTGIKEEFDRFQEHSLLHFPNPFTDYVTIQYSLSEESNVDLRVYDVNGRLLNTIVDRPQQRGNYTVRWFGKNSIGNSLPRGIYFYHLNVGDLHSVGKMLLIR